MRIAVLASPESWYWRDLQRAAQGRHELQCVAFRQLQAALGPQQYTRVTDGRHDLSAFDAVLVRTMPPGSLEQVVFRMNALAELERQGTTVVNPARSLEVAIDKYLTLARLSEQGFRVPATITCQSWESAMEAFEQLGGDVVVKPIFGGEGRGISRIDDAALAWRAFKLLHELGAVLYLQQYVPHAGCDWRLLVIGPQVLAMRRLNPQDFRTNVRRGAITEPLQPDKTVQRLALRAAKAAGCSLAGVDLLPGEDGQLYVLEVNAVPGWKALAATLRLDVAQHVLQWVEQCAGNSA